LSLELPQLRSLNFLLLSILSLVIAIGVSTSIYVANIHYFHPSLAPYFSEANNAQALTFFGKDFIPAGNLNGGFSGRSALVRELNGGELILSRKMNFRAAHFPLIEYKVSPLHSGLPVYIFWRNSEKPDQMNYIALQPSNLQTNIISLADDSNWIGDILELSIFARGDLRDETFELHAISLLPGTPENIVRLTLSEILSLSVWTQASINRVYLGSKGALISPTLIVSCWSLLGIFTYVLLTWGSSGFRRLPNYKEVSKLAGICFLIGWIALDMLWTRRLLFQYQETNYLFSGKTIHEKKLADIDGAIYLDVLGIRQELGSPNSRVWILTGNPNTFLGYRFKYHLTGYPIYYWQDASYTYQMMRLFGFAEKSDFLLLPKPIPKEIRYETTTNLLRLALACSTARTIYESEKSLVLQLTTDMAPC
jgi:hypothetical protein